MVAEIVAGIAGPLVSTTASWLRTRAAVRNQPERLTAVMIQSFIRKLVFFGAYVVIALKVLELQPMPFMIAFTVTFIVLLFAEAVSLSRLFVSQSEGAERGEGAPGSDRAGARGGAPA